MRSTTWGSLGENGNFPGITDHLTFLENCRLTSLLSKIWLRNWQMFFYTFVRFRKIIFYGLILPQIFNIKSFLNTPASIKENRKNQNGNKNWIWLFPGKNLSDLIFLRTTLDKIVLDKLIIFYDCEIIFGVFKDRYMFTGCIFWPPKNGWPLNEENCVRRSSFWENINHDRTTFFLTESPFFFLLFYPFEAK